MKVRGTCLVWLVTCSLANGCGNASKPKPGEPGAGGSSDGDAGEPAAAGVGASATNGGSGGTSGSGASSGAAGDPSGNQAGETNAGAGGNPEPLDPIVRFEVIGDEQVRPISPLIYGANQPGLDCDNPKARFTFCRHRSAAWSTYNWETNASNAGVENCNENNAALSASSTPGAAVLDRIDEADAVGASSIITVPMLGYAATDKDDGSAAPACSGDVSKGDDYLNERFAMSRARKGEALSLTPDLTDDYVNQDEFVAFLAANRAASPLLFSLDHQPELWHVDHAKLQSSHLSYDEHVALSASYAASIKENWPDAKVIGLLGYGYLAAVNAQQSPDYETEGEFYSYYLASMSEQSETAGERLLDYVDLHWYPELYPDNTRLIFENASPASAAERVQAPRSLWDPAFVEESWITGTNGGKPIQLLDWLQGAIDESYPGTQLSLTEWSYGGGKHISGAIAAADALGIYGQRGVGLAGVVSFADGPVPYLIGAFQAYRNYDGEDNGFGDTSVAATTTDAARATIYASVDSNDPSRMVLVAINRSAVAQPVTLSITHDATYDTLAPYCITDGEPEPTAGDAIPSEDANAFAWSLPATSVCVLVPTE
jgi:Glycoside hydrolase family 44